MATLLGSHEFGLLQVGHLSALALTLGMAWHYLPIPDVAIPGDLFEVLWEES